MHYLDPKKELAHVLLVYRNFSKGDYPKCHVGLGVNGLHTAKVLRQHRIRCDVEGVWTVQDIYKMLRKYPTVTHCVIEAPWVSAQHTAEIMHAFPNVHFVVRAHSQIGFLQVEPGAIKIMRDLMHLQEGALNLTVSANSRKLCAFFERTYLGRCLYLPNLYDLQRPRARRNDAHDHKLLRIGSFGALRLMKNHATSAAAALLIAEKKRCDLEFWISVNREEHGKGVLTSLRNMFSGLGWARLVENPWEPWTSFRRTIGIMDLTLQASYSETMNIVSCDSVAEGVPVVVSDAIEWAPHAWKADVDSAEDIARKGTHLLNEPFAVDEGIAHLEAFCKEGVHVWLGYLDSQP